MYGQPRVVIMPTPNHLGYVEAFPIPMNAQVWRDHRAPDLHITPESSQSLTPDTIHECGPLAGHAAETWNIHPLHLAVSFKQLAR
jgi:hypothetical protein